MMRILIATGGSDWHGHEFTPHLHIGEVHYTEKDGTVVWPTYRMVQAIMERQEQNYGPCEHTFDLGSF